MHVWVQRLGFSKSVSAFSVILPLLTSARKFWGRIRLSSCYRSCSCSWKSNRLTWRDRSSVYGDARTRWRIGGQLVHCRLIHHWRDREVARDFHSLGVLQAFRFGESRFKCCLEVLCLLAELANSTHDHGIGARLLDELALWGGWADNNSVLDFFTVWISDGRGVSGGEWCTFSQWVACLLVSNLSQIESMVLVHALVHFDCGCNVQGGSEENCFHSEWAMWAFSLYFLIWL